jgi:hypothetical protein
MCILVPVHLRKLFRRRRRFTRALVGTLNVCTIGGELLLFAKVHKYVSKNRPARNVRLRSGIGKRRYDSLKFLASPCA